MHPETLRPFEKKFDQQQKPAASADNSLHPAQLVLQQRFLMLQQLRTYISRKLYFALEEKLQREKQELEQLLGQKSARQQLAARYSNILDTQYFEQILLIDQDLMI